MGPLPPTGRWVRLEVPASILDLESHSLNGMAFTLVGGRATWDRAGKVCQDTVFIDDSLPAGASAGNWSGNNEPDMSFTTPTGSTPLPISGSKIHISPLFNGEHQHYFYNASGMPVLEGDVMYAYVYLDPANMPEEIMVQWNAGNTDNPDSWAHRAYWGKNNIQYGTNDTASQRYAGQLPQAPPTGGWVRLEIPASYVGLVGMQVKGMAFTASKGQVYWDAAGKRSHSHLDLSKLKPQSKFYKNHAG